MSVVVRLTVFAVVLYYPYIGKRSSFKNSPSNSFHAQVLGRGWDEFVWMRFDIKAFSIENKCIIPAEEEAHSKEGKEKT